MWIRYNELLDMVWCGGQDCVGRIRYFGVGKKRRGGERVDAGGEGREGVFVEDHKRLRRTVKD